MKIIGIIGVIGSGKNYTAKQLYSKYENCKFVGFSEGVRQFTWGAIGWRPRTDDEYEKFKYRNIAFRFPHEGVKLIKGRKLMENIGIMMRNYDSNFWADYWLKMVKGVLPANIIACDCRYRNEANNIIKLAKGQGYEYEFIFANYKSNRYEIRDDDSEKFAQEFVNEGFNNQDNITKRVEEKCKQ